MIKRSILALAGVAALALAPGVDGATRKTVKMGDNYYSPT